jgi:hypothetical protein
MDRAAAGALQVAGRVVAAAIANLYPDGTEGALAHPHHAIAKGHRRPLAGTLLLHY